MPVKINKIKLKKKVEIEQPKFLQESILVSYIFCTRKQNIASIRLAFLCIQGKEISEERLLT